MNDQRVYHWEGLTVYINWDGEYEPEHDDDGECEMAVVDLYGDVKAYNQHGGLVITGDINIEWEAWGPCDFPDLDAIKDALEALV